jgi:hypothetical protein
MESRAKAEAPESRFSLIFLWSWCKFILERSSACPYGEMSAIKSPRIDMRQTASAYLKQLADAGVLIERQAGKEKLFIHPKLITLLRQDDNPFTHYVGEGVGETTKR